MAAKKTKTTKTKRVTKVPRTRNAGTMTESQFFGKIRSALRNSFRYWKPMQLALDKASRPNQSANKKLKKEYQCNHCQNWFPRDGVEIDHKTPAGSLKSLDDIKGFLERLTVEDIDAYQILCKQDHLAKSISEKNKK